MDGDPHLAQLAKAPFQRLPLPLRTIHAQEASVYTLRGPRQVGKTTLLKQLAARLIRDEGWDPRLVVYYPLDLADRPRQLVDLVLRVKAAYPAGQGKHWCSQRQTFAAIPCELFGREVKLVGVNRGGSFVGFRGVIVGRDPLPGSLLHFLTGSSCLLAALQNVPSGIVATPVQPADHDMSVDRGNSVRHLV